MIFNKDTLAQDFKSGFFVFLLALPLCLGISIASGCPPIAGIFTAVVGGIVASLIGSSRLTIKGPAAGLIVIVVGAVTELGAGDPMTGYKRMLAVAAVAAVIQIIFGLVKAGIIGEIIPGSVVHGMLSAIGVIIIAKQSHNLLGVKPDAKTPFGLLAEFPTHITQLNPEVFLIGGLTILLLALWPKFAKGKLKQVPAAILALAGSMALASFFDFEHGHNYEFLQHIYHVDGSLLINLPASFFSAMTFPDFSVITSFISIKYIIMLSLVGSIESLLTVNAIDSIDPERKTSNLNKDLLATGFGNLIASLIGGLPMISEIVRSKANVDNGAKTAQSNFFHGCLLLISVVLFPNILHMIPAATLAAMLVFTGFRLASPAEFEHTYKIGIDQFAPFMTTFIVTLVEDLLVGVILGVVVQLIINLYHGMKFSDLLNIRTSSHDENGTLRLKILGPIGFTNSYKLKRTLEQELPKNSKIILDFTDSHLVEHSAFNTIETIRKNNQNVSIEIVGLDTHTSVSGHHHATRRRKITL
jgi:MFS superfamily sulfate permease-like transporter